MLQIINMGSKSSVLMQVYFVCMNNDLTAKEKPKEKGYFLKSDTSGMILL